MPSFSKLIILFTFLLLGVLSLPTALPEGVRGKREADPKPDNSFHFGGDLSGGLTRGGSYKREAAPAPKPDNSFHFNGDFDGGLTRGGSYKREAEADPEARNTLEHIAISPEPQKEKREATPEPAPAADNSFHFGGDFDGGLTRGGSSKRDAEANPEERNTLEAIANFPETGKREAAADNSFHFGGDFDGGLTRGGSYKRDAEVDAEEE
jgi:hypothetical protein